MLSAFIQFLWKSNLARAEANCLCDAVYFPGWTDRLNSGCVWADTQINEKKNNYTHTSNACVHSSSGSTCMHHSVSIHYEWRENRLKCTTMTATATATDEKMNNKNSKNSRVDVSLRFVMRHKVRAANSVCMRFAGCCRSFICPCHLGCIVDFIRKSMRHKTMAFQRHFSKISTMTKNNLIFLGKEMETKRKWKKKLGEPKHALIYSVSWQKNVCIVNINGMSCI